MMKRVLFLIILVSTFLVPNLWAQTGNGFKSDVYYMALLVKKAQNNKAWPFAAMIVNKDTGKILCEGLNSQSTNPTDHGEMMAINNCSKKYPRLNWSKTILYTTAEPCSMCEGAVIWARISKVVYGTSIPYLIKKGWKQINIRAKNIIKTASFYHGSVVGGVLHKQTDALFKTKKP